MELEAGLEFHGFGNMKFRKDPKRTKQKDSKVNPSYALVPCPWCASAMKTNETWIHVYINT